jgi:hypothetical protein
MPRVSDIDNACGISAHHMFLSNCVVQVMRVRVWSLAAVLSLLAKQHCGIYATASRSGQRTAFRTEFVVAVV